MKTTTPQLITILFGIVLIVAMGLYLPWRVEVTTLPEFRCSAYGSLFFPPQTVDVDFGSGAESRPCRVIGLAG